MWLDNYERRTVRTRTLNDGRIEILAPGVGLWSGQPQEQALLGGGSVVGAFRCRSKRFLLVLPPETQGRVVALPHDDRVATVEYGETLFVIAEIGALDSGPDSSHGRSRGGKAGQDLPAGVAAVRAPTDGVFYLRPAPGDPPFIEVGKTIRIGTTLGLVEVMKTFNPILYGAQDLPQETEVLEIRVEDGAEINAGDILLTVQTGT